MRKYMVKLYFFLAHVVALPRDWFYCVLHGVSYHSDWRFYGLPLFQKRRGCAIYIGARFKACSKAAMNSIGVFQRVMLKANGSHSRIVIGDDVGMSGCVVSASELVEIGNHVLIGSGALITDSDAHALDWQERRFGNGGVSKPVKIEDDVFIGARVIILKGVTLGKRSVVGAGSVVTHDVPPGMIVAGNPARVVGEVR